MRSDKIKDMIRSILPSTARNRARFAKRRTIRQNRLMVRKALRQDPDATKLDVRRGANQSMNVRERRWADKLNHFMRWCGAITKGMSTDEALGHVRGILPSSLIGDHAYGHWERKRKPFPYGWRPYQRPQSRESFCDSTTFRLQRALAVAPGLHRALNAAIKLSKQEGEPRRLLRGIHDVHSFVEDIAFRDESRYRKDVPDPFAIERRTTLEMIEKIEKGGREAALQVYARLAAAINARGRSAIESVGGGAMLIHSPGWSCVIASTIRGTSGSTSSMRLRVLTTTTAMPRARRFCWNGRSLSAVTKQSNPSATAARRRTPFRR